jgi:hypothetical protein
MHHQERSAAGLFDEKKKPLAVLKRHNGGMVTLSLNVPYLNGFSEQNVSVTRAPHQNCRSRTAPTSNQEETQPADQFLHGQNLENKLLSVANSSVLKVVS